MPKIMLSYIRKPISKKRIPTGMRVSPPKGEPYGVVAAVVEGKKFSLGYSLCYKKDQWNRDRGRSIAITRAEEDFPKKGKNSNYWKKLFIKKLAEKGGKSSENMINQFNKQTKKNIKFSGNCRLGNVYREMLILEKIILKGKNPLNGSLPSKKK